MDAKKEETQRGIGMTPGKGVQLQAPAASVPGQEHNNTSIRFHPSLVLLSESFFFHQLAALLGRVAIASPSAFAAHLKFNSSLAAQCAAVVQQHAAPDLCLSDPGLCNT